ncbi:MAG: radical SAM protein [Acidobacteriota bacterium]
MRVKLILPALTEAKSPYFRPIKYSLFPPLGLATLAGYLGTDDEIELVDEHVEPVPLDDRPDLVVIQVYITSASRSYELADYYRRRGAYVCLGGLHVTALPEEAATHADTLFLGPGEQSWPQFLRDFREGNPAGRYQSSMRTLAGLPLLRRDLFKRSRYLVPNSLVVSRGCPHHCDFCYKDSFFTGERSFYTETVDRALEEIDNLPGRHLYFLDDHLFGTRRFAVALLSGLRGMGRVWQAAGTVKTVLDPELLDLAAESGLRSLFVGFETLNPAGLAEQQKWQNLRQDYRLAVQMLHDRGIMINGSFVFGMDHDGPDVFDRTVDWAVEAGLETATFHILTPYPGTRLYERMRAEGRIFTHDWNLYDTRHCVYMPARLTPRQLEEGYWKAYTNFYRWSSIARAASTKHAFLPFLRHVAYAGGWKKLEPFWVVMIHSGLLGLMRPVLETVLDAGRQRATENQGAYLPSAASQIPGQRNNRFKTKTTTPTGVRS